LVFQTTIGGNYKVSGEDDVKLAESEAVGCRAFGITMHRGLNGAAQIEKKTI
jgi:hypothetical protein